MTITMIRAETERLLDQLALLLGEKGAADGLIDQLVALHDSALAAEVHRRLLAGQFQYHVRPIVKLLERLGGADAEKGLRHCLSLPDGNATVPALRALRPFLGEADVPMLAQFIRGADRSVREAAIVAAGHLRAPALADLVAERLSSDSSDERMQAAITLGILGARQYASCLVDRLESETDRVFGAFVAALEMLEAREAVPRLVDLLRQAPESKVWDLTHALGVITGIDPLADQEDQSKSSDLRAAWLQAAEAGQLERPPPAKLVKVRKLGRNLARFDLAFGRGVLRIDFDPPSAGTTWPRWSQSLFAAGKRVYAVGSLCGTCELFLRLVGWPDEGLLEVARRLETTGLESGLEKWISAWTPLLEQLRSGRYLVARLTIPLERIDEEAVASSWFNRRYEIRAEVDADNEYEREDARANPFWSGTLHYQGPRIGQIPTYPVVMPAQDPSRLSESRIEEYRKALAAGARPPVVALAWLDAREVQTRWEERFLSLIVLNGHHRLEAYARDRIAAPIIAVARVADSWGPPGERDKYLREAFEALTPR